MARLGFCDLKSGIVTVDENTVREFSDEADEEDFVRAMELRSGE